MQEPETNMRAAEPGREKVSVELDPVPMGRFANSVAATLSPVWATLVTDITPCRMARRTRVSRCEPRIWFVTSQGSRRSREAPPLPGGKAAVATTWLYCFGRVGQQQRSVCRRSNTLCCGSVDTRSQSIVVIIVHDALAFVSVVVFVVLVSSCAGVLG